MKVELKKFFVLLKNHDIFSLDKNDIGLATILKHIINLKDNKATYRK